jgi:hypothetical protein
MATANSDVFTSPLELKSPDCHKSNPDAVPGDGRLRKVDIRIFPRHPLTVLGEFHDQGDNVKNKYY